MSSTIKCDRPFCDSVKAVAENANEQTCLDYASASRVTCSSDPNGSLCCNNVNIHKMSTKCNMKVFPAAQTFAQKAVKDFQKQSLCK